MEKNIRRDDWETLDPTVFGWGIVDVNYTVQVKKDIGRIGGKRKRLVEWTCPYYEDWIGMVRRCFCLKFRVKHPTYEGATTYDDWRYLSNFIEWVDSQPNKDWQNCSLDKDFLSKGLKCYSPDTAVYIPRDVNSFIVDRTRDRGNLMIGVVALKANKSNPYQAQCNNHTTGTVEYLGTYPTELEAHLAWKAKKHEHACALADLQQDERIAKRLREMYSPDTDWTNK